MFYPPGLSTAGLSDPPGLSKRDRVVVGLRCPPQGGGARQRNSPSKASKAKKKAKTKKKKK